MKKLLFLLVIAGFCSHLSFAQTTLYSTGGTFFSQLDWNTLGTFNTQADGLGTDKVPLATDNVIIRNDHHINLGFGQSGVCNNLEVQNTARFFVSGTATLTIAGDFTLRNSVRVDLVANSTTSVGGDLDLFGDGAIHTAFVIGDGAKLQLLGTSLSTIGLSNAEELISGANGILEIGSATITAGYEIFGGTGKLSFYGVLAPINGNLETNGLLTLKATTSTSFGRIQWCDYDANSATSRSVYSGTISGNVTMEKVTESTGPSGLPTNNGWRQWSFPLNTGASGITGLDIKGVGHPTLNERNAFYWSARIYSGAPQLSLVGTAPPPYPANETLRNLKTDADGWAEGWLPANESNMYRRGYTIYSSSNPSTNATYGYDIASKITVTGTVGTDNIRGGYNLAGTAEDLTASGTYLPGSQDTGIGTATGNNDIGWVQIANPWPSILDTWFILRGLTSGGAYLSSAAGAEFTSQYNGIHVWDARNQQYLGWTGNLATFGSVIYNTGGGVTAPNPTQAQFDILPFQSFWVKRETGAFTNPGLDLDRRFTKPAIEGPAYLKTTTLTDLVALAVFDSDSARDTWGVHYDADYTDNFDLDGGDTYKIFSSSNVPSLHSIEAGQNAHVVSRMPKASDTIQLYFYSFKNNKPCHFLFNDLYAGNLNVVLHDKKTNTYHDLSQNPTYTFTHNTSNDANRFELIIANASISIDEEPLLDNPVSIYISGDELVIKSEQFTGPAQIDCYDMAGRLLFQRRVDVFAGSEFRLTAPLAKNQINLINVTANGQQYVEKLVK